MGPLNITSETHYQEIVDILLEARRDIETSLSHMADMNIGLAKLWAGQALNKLPQDTDQGIYWHVYE